MKKIIALFLLLATGMVVSAQDGSPAAPRHRTSSFFSVPATYVCVSNNYTLLYGSTTNTTFVPLAIGTNVVGGASNSVAGIGTTYPFILGDVFVNSDANGNNPSASISIAYNQVTNYVGNAASGSSATFDNLGATGMKNWPVYPGFTNSLGAPGIPVSLFGNNVNETNTITVVFAVSRDGFNFGTTAIDKLSVQFSTAASVITANGLVVQTTNVPSAFLQGARKLRCLSIGTSDAGGTANGVTINALNFNQWIP